MNLRVTGRDASFEFHGYTDVYALLSDFLAFYRGEQVNVPFMLTDLWLITPDGNKYTLLSSLERVDMNAVKYVMEMLSRMSVNERQLVNMKSIQHFVDDNCNSSFLTITMKPRHGLHEPEHVVGIMSLIDAEAKGEVIHGGVPRKWYACSDDMDDIFYNDYYHLGKVISEVCAFEWMDKRMTDDNILYREQNPQTGEMVYITFGDIKDAIIRMKREKGLNGLETL